MDIEIFYIKALNTHCALTQLFELVMQKSRLWLTDYSLTLLLSRGALTF